MISMLLNIVCFLQLTFVFVRFLFIKTVYTRGEVDLRVESGLSLYVSNYDSEMIEIDPKHPRCDADIYRRIFSARVELLLTD